MKGSQIFRMKAALSFFERSSVLLPIAAIGMVVCIAAASPSLADPIDAGAVQRLALQGIWYTEEDDMGYWIWNEDGSVCLRLFEPADECADNGTWSLNDEALCYELEWWGEVYGYRENCFTVHSLGDGRYQAHYLEERQESIFITFSVLE